MSFRLRFYPYLHPLHVEHRKLIKPYLSLGNAARCSETQKEPLAFSDHKKLTNKKATILTRNYVHEW